MPRWIAEGVHMIAVSLKDCKNEGWDSVLDYFLRITKL